VPIDNTPPERRNLKLLIAGGGTGGHIFPALAVAHEWLARDASRGVLFVGTQRGLETRLIPEAGFQLETIRSAGLKGMGALKLAQNLMLLGPSMLDSAAILRRERYAAAFGVGGYAAGPVMLVASLKKVPTVIFEPNAEPGFTNRALAKFVMRIATGYESVAQRFGRRATFTGCPVRAEFFEIPPSQPAPPYRILITGGSQGSHKINQAVLGALQVLTSQKSRISFVHQTGQRDYNEIHPAYSQHGFEAEVAPFFSNMSERFAQTDLIVCRSGAITVAEIAAAGRAALFIPFGAATDSHQLRNAQEMVRAGAARLITEAELTGERLAEEIAKLLESPESLVELGAQARKLARPNAASDIVNLIEGVARA
jgi:UDP-N-acetylglucosamine--N-acetylmuramyl-(pentapeptide) pyrophosphoryl-undecaprenol N-acetylglucosamine transferase